MDMINIFIKKAREKDKVSNQGRTRSTWRKNVTKNIIEYIGRGDLIKVSVKGRLQPGS